MKCTQDSDTNAGDEGVIPVATAGAKPEQGSEVVRREASLDTNPVTIPVISEDYEDSAHVDSEVCCWCCLTKHPLACRCFHTCFTWLELLCACDIVQMQGFHSS